MFNIYIKPEIPEEGSNNIFIPVYKKGDKKKWRTIEK